MPKTASMRPPRTSPQTLTKAQLELQREFCRDYGFNPNQISFDGDEPIFDFDALSVLSMRLCDLPDIHIDLSQVNAQLGLATSTGLVVLPGGKTRKTFAAAIVHEEMPDGNPIRDMGQAIAVSRARALRIVLRAVGFDPVAAHKVFKSSNGTRKLELLPIDLRTRELAEIHMLAQALDFIVVNGGGFINKIIYQRTMTTYFPERTSARDMTEQERAQWLNILRAFTKAKHVIAQEGKAAKAV